MDLDYDVLKIEESPDDFSYEEGVSDFPRELCEEPHESSVAFALHSIKHSTAKKYHCHHCRYETKTQKRMKGHMWMHGNSGKFCQCETCPAIFPESIQAAEHENYHSGEMPHKCETCGKSFMFSWLLSTHRRLFHLVSFTCDTCSGQVGTVEGLRKHILRKHNSVPKEPILCDICRRDQGSTETLKLQQRIRTLNKQNGCDRCGKGVPSTVHMKKHIEERPFVCSVCHKGFVSKKGLVIHQHKHKAV